MMGAYNTGYFTLIKMNDKIFFTFLKIKIQTKDLS